MFSGFISGTRKVGKISEICLIWIRIQGITTVPNHFCHFWLFRLIQNLNFQSKLIHVTCPQGYKMVGSFKCQNNCSVCDSFRFITPRVVYLYSHISSVPLLASPSTKSLMISMINSIEMPL